MKRTASTMLRQAANGVRCAGDRRVVITGGSSGVGVALVAALLQREGRGQIYVTGTRPFEDTQLCEMLRERSEDDAERVRYSVGDTGCTEAVQKPSQRRWPTRCSSSKACLRTHSS